MTASRPHKTTNTRRDSPQGEHPSPARSLRTQQRTHDPPPAARPVPADPHPREPTHTTTPTKESNRCVSRRTRHHTTSSEPNSQCSTHEHTTTEHSPVKWHLDHHPPGDGLKLLRKEVIQPHLPVRLPCYDFVPIADPTFDGSLPTRGLGHRLRVLPTFVT